MFFKPLLVLCVVSPDLIRGAPMVPSLPGQYSTIVEANIINKNYTMESWEAYDYPNSRTVSVHHLPGGVHVHTLSLFELDATVSWSTETGSRRPVDCTIGQISKRHLQRETSHGHLKTSAQFLDFGDPDQPSEEYLGVSSARGIRTDVWRSQQHHTVGRGNLTMDVTFQFAQSDWSVHAHDRNEPGPVRTEVKGTMTGATSKETRSFHHLYEFIRWQSGPPDEVHFMLPAPIYWDTTRDVEEELHWNYPMMCNATRYCTSGPGLVMGEGAGAITINPLSTDLCPPAPSKTGRPVRGPALNDSFWHTSEYALAGKAPPTIVERYVNMVSLVGLLMGVVLGVVAGAGIMYWYQHKYTARQRLSLGPESGRHAGRYKRQKTEDQMELN